MTKKAVFLDRDGTLNEDIGYLSDPKGVILLPGVPEGLAKLKREGFLLIVVSNQSGVARGYFTEADIMDVNLEILRQIRSKGGDLDAFYYCPHHPSEGFFPYVKKCKCRKPKPGMILSAVKEWNIDLGSSFLIGDKESDIQTASSLNMFAVLIGKYSCSIERNSWQRVLTFTEAVNVILDKG